jgi:hypothetical protein
MCRLLGDKNGEAGLPTLNTAHKSPHSESCVSPTINFTPLALILKANLEKISG